jgi:hypothetical protein
MGNNVKCQQWNSYWNTYNDFTYNDNTYNTLMGAISYNDIT